MGAIRDAVLELVFRILWFAFNVLFRLVVFVRREGPALPRGPVIVAPNHCSFMDPVVLQMSAWRHLSFLMTEVFYRPRGTRWIFQLVRAIPVKEGRTNRDALEASAEALRRGWAVCIFPEGGIARDGRLQRFHPGVAALAAATGAPVVPVAIEGTFEAYPRHRSFPRLFRKVVVRYGAPIAAPVPGDDEASKKEMWRSFAERLHAEVAARLPERAQPAGS